MFIFMFMALNVVVYVCKLYICIMYIARLYEYLSRFRFSTFVLTVVGYITFVCVCVCVCAFRISGLANLVLSFS